MPPPRPSPRFQSRAHNAATDDPEDAQEDAAEDETDDDDCEDGDDIDLIRAKRAQRERPLSFANMSEVKSRFESGAELTKEERREERKQEIQNIRSRLFMGKQAKIKEMYQQAVLDSEQGVRAVDRRADAVMADMGDRARSIKDRFEKGQVFRGDGQDGGEAAQPAVHQVDEDAAVFEQGNERGQGKFRKGNIKGDFFLFAGLGKQSRSLFMEMDANAARTPSHQSQPQTPTPRTPEIRNRVAQVSTDWPPHSSPSKVPHSHFPVQITTNNCLHSQFTNTKMSLIISFKQNVPPFHPLHRIRRSWTTL